QGRKRPAVAAAKEANPVESASAPQPITKTGRPRGRNATDVSPPVETDGGPAHSMVQMIGTLKETPAMRSVALDLAVRKISYCEIEADQVVARRTVTSLSSL